MTEETEYARSIGAPLSYAYPIQYTIAARVTLRYQFTSIETHMVGAAESVYLDKPSIGKFR
jgi:hypothetical protein